MDFIECKETFTSIHTIEAAEVPCWRNDTKWQKLILSVAICSLLAATVTTEAMWSATDQAKCRGPAKAPPLFHITPQTLSVQWAERSPAIIQWESSLVAVKLNASPLQSKDTRRLNSVTAQGDDYELELSPMIRTSIFFKRQRICSIVYCIKKTRIQFFFTEKRENYASCRNFGNTVCLAWLAKAYFRYLFQQQKHKPLPDSYLTN